MDLLLQLSLGLSFFLTVLLFRMEKSSKWPGLYWMFFLLLGVTVQFAPSYAFLLIFFISHALSGYIRFRFEGSDNKYGSYIGVAGMALFISTMVLYTSFGHFTVLVYLIIEIYFLQRSFQKYTLKRGISWSSNSGFKLWWLLCFTALNLVTFFLLYLVLIGYPLEWMVFSYSIVCFLGLVRYTASDPFGPVFPRSRYLKSTLDLAEKYRLLEAIDQVFGKDRFHLDNKASLNGLAGMVGSTPHQVSQVINESRGMNFFELVAHHRVKEAKKLMRSEKYKHYKIEEIAELVGYMSKSAFNTAFKKETGQTPSSFRDRDVRHYKVERQPYGEIGDPIKQEGTFGFIKNSMVMFNNFFKVYLRNQLKNKVFASINLVGLVLGLCASMLIYSYLDHELSYDKFHDRAEDIYRISWRSSNPQTRTQHPLAQALVKDFSQVESAVSLTPMYGPGLTLQTIYVRNSENNIMFQEPDAFMADSTFFDVFDFKLIAGNPKEALSGVGNLVITEKLAKKYFGSESPLGKSLELVDYDFRGVIAGVMENPPVASHFHPQLMVSYVTRKSVDGDNPWFSWDDAGHFNYIKLRPNSDPQELEDQIPDWLTNYVDLPESDVEAMKNKLAYFSLDPITDIHLHSNIRWELETNGNIVFIYILLASIGFLLVICAINYINLTTARAVERGKEVGIRRALGANKWSVSAQFILEGVVTCLAALFLAWVIAFAVQDLFIDLAGKSISPQILWHPVFIGFSVFIVVIIGMVTGIFPAMFVSRLIPVEVLKGKLVNQSKGFRLREILVALQFIVAIIMIYGTTIVLDQINYMEKKGLGFDHDQVVVVEIHTEEEVDRLEAIKAEVNKVPGVLASGGISNLPGSQFNQNEIYKKGDIDNAVSSSELRVDFDALPLLGLSLSEGRWFDKTMAQDSLGISFIVNQAALDQLNLKDKFADKIVWNEEAADREGTIVGVLENFHFKSLHKPIQPMVINVNTNALNYLLIKIQGEDASETLAQLETIHQKFDNDFDFDWFFLDRQIEDQYQAERRSLEIFRLFTGIALILSSLGLLGLAYLVITQRTKEIGIRKAMGARVVDIIAMENKTFLKIIIPSFIVGIPIGYLLMTQWLNGFAYRVDFSILPYILTIIIPLIVTVFSVTLAVLRTSLMNPSNALRYE